MAAKALLTAAGFLKSTATEHATRASQSGRTSTKDNSQKARNSTATEHATSASQSGSTALRRGTALASQRGKGKRYYDKRSWQAEDPSTKEPTTIDLTTEDSTTKDLASQRDQFDENGGLEDNDVEKIVALLLWMAQDYQKDFSKDDIHDAALQVMSKQSNAAIHLLHTAPLKKLSKLIDIMMLDKEGTPKDAKETLQFIRRVVAIRWTLLTRKSDNATEPVELEEGEVSKCYQLLGRSLLTHDLLPHQKKDKKYWIQNKPDNDTYLTGFQRSFTDNILRKRLGDRKVAFRIWQHGIPSIADRAVRFRRHIGLEVDMSMLQSSLDDCLQWYICLANDIVAHQSQEGFAAQLAASSRDPQERQQQQTRREGLQQAKDALRTGAALASQRDKGKRSYHDMDEDEQQCLEDYDTGKTQKAKKRKTLPVLKPFRSHDWVNR